MAEDGAKRGLLDFFRSRSGSGPKKDDKKRSPDSDPRRKRYDSDDDEYSGSRRHRRRSPERRNKHDDGDGPLPAEWPPSTEELPLGKAMDLISRGAPIHKGHKRPVPRGPDEYYPLAPANGHHKKDDPAKKAAAAAAAVPHDDGAVQKPADEFYMLSTTTQKARPEDTDCANLRDIMVRPMTMRRVQGEEPAENPWDTLEQPSYSFFFGKLPGTVSLTQWAASGNNVPPSAATTSLPDGPTGATVRDVDMIRVFERLRELEKGIEDDGDDELYRSLYRRFLRDPDKNSGSSPQRSLDRQIADLVLVLSRPEWIDFSNTKNQIVTRFIFDVAEIDPHNYLKFFHQLLLSLELDLRVCFKQPSAQDRLIAQFPPSVMWSLALARRWKDNVRIEAFGHKPDQVKLRYRRKRKQVKMLEDFARLMKWPNLTETIKALRQMETDNVLDTISSHAMAFFSGLVLPGPTWPFIVICTLIDVDPDSATDKIALLTPLQPHCGFQYRNAHTYWSASSIVGKVLAPTARSIAGWVGPCRSTDHLGRSQIAKVRSYRGRQAMPVMDITSMSERSDPLGPPANVYPAREYDPIDPDLDKPATCIKFQQMNFKAAGVTGEEPRWFEAAANFVFKGVPMDLRLKYDVTFICAFPCHDGPHPLFFDYTRHVVRVDDLPSIHNWGGLLPDAEAGTPPSEEVEDKEKVLAVEAYGARDNEVYARAWCSLWGHSAVVADIRRTCISCAIREAFASTLTVLILIDSKPEDPARSDSKSRKDRDDSRFGKEESRRERDRDGRDREKDRDRERDREKDRDRERDRDRDREREDPRGTRGSLHKS